MPLKTMKERCILVNGGILHDHVIIQSHVVSDVGRLLDVITSSW